MNEIGVLRELAAAAWTSGHLAEGQPIPPANISGGLDDDLRGCGSRVAEKVGVYSKDGNVLGLALRYCGLRALPDSLGQLAALRHLDLTGNELSELPESMRGMGDLRSLYLDENQLAWLPGWIDHFGELRELHVDKNQLTSLPADLVRLERLHARGNRLESVPESLGSLESLEDLRLGTIYWHRCPTRSGI
jgi:Leucine-rich repeat (LRR) protein